MAEVHTSTMLDESSFDVDKLTYEIFSILENKFLFGGYDDPKLSKNTHQVPIQEQLKPTKQFNGGKVRILSIDGGGATNGILAAKSLTHLESCLRRKSGNPDASISDYFDVVAGSGSGGILAALLFTRGKNGRPMFTAEEALSFLVRISKKMNRAQGKFLKNFRRTNFERHHQICPDNCYDLSTHAPFLFSRADALEMDGYDFKMSDVCRAVGMRSVDRRTKIMAIDGGIAMNNPTAAAITHVLNNKQEFPLCNGVENLLVVSLGNGESDFGVQNQNSTPARFVRIAGEGASDMVDQAVSMAFGPCRTSNYVRIQEGRFTGHDCRDVAQKNVESVLFEGKKIVESTNSDKLETFSGELIREQERRTTSILPTVVLKQNSPSPRTSSATSFSTLSSY
ncbi:patatin protein [Salix suchowensis]|nr:patatin protein [Salix suchowensis]